MSKIEAEVLPTYSASPGRRASEAYSHRRTSTSTIIRLAVTSARAGQVPMPTRIITTIALFLSILYVASFIPYLAPLAFRGSRSPGMISVTNPFIPTYSEKYAPSSTQQDDLLVEKLPTKARPDSPIGDTAQRQAWSHHFDHRVPPHLAPPPPVHIDIPTTPDGAPLHSLAEPDVQPEAAPARPPTSYQAELMRELLVNAAKAGKVGAAAAVGGEIGMKKVGKGRAAPKRLGGVQQVEMKQVEIPSVEEKLREVTVEEVNEVEESAVDAQRAANLAAAEKSRQRSAMRMEKMKAAKQGSARVGAIAPLDSSTQQKDDDHVFTKDRQAKKKPFKGGRKLSADDADQPKPRDIAAAVGNGHPRNHQAPEPVVVAIEPEAPLQEAAEDWAEVEIKGDE